MNDDRSPEKPRAARMCRRGLSLIEMLVALAISAVLLTATAVAIDTSFTAYAIAAESASTQTSTRMVINRLLTLVRTNVAHGPLTAADAALEPTESVTFVTSRIIESSYLELLDGDGDTIKISYDAPNQRLMLTRTPSSGATPTTQPILGGVTTCTFHLRVRLDNDGIEVLERGSIDFTVQPDGDATLDLEDGNIPPVRVIASTKPRRLD
ncbi:MAG: prepilin-type N-terminal cleavage/methylation domain-containing protein [Planctomycetota bacterium]